MEGRAEGCSAVPRGLKVLRTGKGLQGAGAGLLSRNPGGKGLRVGIAAGNMKYRVK